MEVEHRECSGCEAIGGCPGDCGIVLDDERPDRLKCPECESTDLYGGWNVRAYGDVGRVEQDGGAIIEQSGDWEYGDADGVDMVSCHECGWVVDGEYVAAWVTGAPVKVAAVVDQAAAADALSFARTALTDPGALPITATVEARIAYAVERIDQAMNLLRTDGE